MLPLKDLNPTRRIPVITYALIVVNVSVFLWEQSIPLSEPCTTSEASAQQEELS